MKIANASEYPELMTVAEAAAFAGRSASWVRRYRDFGPLVPDVIGRHQAVTTRSLLALLASYHARLRTGKRVQLRLVVDNT